MRIESSSPAGRRGSIGALFLMLLAGLLGSGSARAATTRPCDLYAAATPCVAAFSTTRALYSSYTGSLYQVTRQSDNAVTDIGLLSDGYANAAAQDTFCANTSCTITKIYDQSPNGNHLTPAPPGGAAQGPGPNGYDNAAVANALPVAVGGHKAYGVYVTAGTGYRNDSTSHIATNGQAEGVYMVSSAINLNGSCCFDFGNAETNAHDNGYGHMDAINIMACAGPCSPTAGLDMENGIPGGLPVPGATPFVTVMGANDGQHTYAIYQGNAQSGALTSTGTIALPSQYQPMHQEGAIILGIGGDNSNWATGYFFEGVMTQGAPTSSAMSAVQSNVVSAGYGGLLPYHDAFASGSAPGWTTYDGSWSVSGGAYVNSAVDGNGDKAVTGSPTWDNYTVQGDVQITSGSGDAGLIFRVTNPAAGTDSLDGYYLGVSANGNLVLGREEYGWALLQQQAISGGVATGTWYHLNVQAVGCTFTVSAQPVGSTTVTGFTYTDAGCTLTAGAVGVRSYSAAAKWRDISVATGGSSSLAYYAPFAASGSTPAGWTNYAGTWSLSSESYINTASDTSGDKSVGGPTFGNFTLVGDVQLSSNAGNAGFIVRVTSPSVGTDALNGYYVGINASGSALIGRESHGWTQLAGAPLNSLPGSTAYHLTARLNGCQIKLTVQPVNGANPANEVTVNDCTYASGQIGVRSYATGAQWRFVSVTPN